MIKTISGFFMMFFLSQAVIAADAPIFSKKGKAVRGTDVVAYFALSEGDEAVKGSDDFTTEWNGTTWYFSSAENKEKFVAEPEKYAPQYGGYCAFAVSHNFTKPTDPNAWKIVDGKLYLNLSKGVQKKWLKDVPGNIKKADANWPSVLN